ncbi:MAG TPA: 5'/3'-nucleotidase SurE [Fibrobacteria bacterium]|nr:5'/3'-nucleotidase SurE [Fibrobacteria bacterium]HOX50604.1 5'/3'-nucleotidase SurE [Fibrobacteria bacterium]
MKVLVVNDDGPESFALAPLVEALRGRHDVFVSVPSQQRSGTGHGFSFLAPLEVRRATIAGAPGVLVTGLPADAVKFAICGGAPWKPDVVLAGINPGENAGVCAPYSGTVACAREAAMFGIPALALSSMGMDKAHYRAIADWAARLLESGLPPHRRGVFWSVNFPLARPTDWGEVKVCHGSTSMFRDVYRPAGPNLWQLEGTKDPQAIEPGSDDDWLSKGHPTMVAHRADPTDHEYLQGLDWIPPRSIRTGET